MARIPRMLITGEPAVYHVMSRSALPGLPLGPSEKNFIFEQIKLKSRFYFTEILGFCVMGNHFHILVKMLPEQLFSDEEIRQRFDEYYGDSKDFSELEIPLLREKLSSLPEFMKDIKVTFSRYYNKKHDRKGYFWGDRYKSVIVEKGETLINCLAYIDLNPVRAGIVEQPEDYQWSSIGYHTQTENAGGFLSLDFGFHDLRGTDPITRFEHYKKFLYKTGAIKRKEKDSPDHCIPKINTEPSDDTQKADRFKYRTRHFSDGGVIGTKEFVKTCAGKFNNIFQTKRKKIPKPIAGLDGIFSLKRISG